MRRPRASGYQHLAWQIRVDAPSSLSEVQTRLLAHLDKEGGDRERLGQANDAVVHLLSVLANHWEGPLVVSFAWGWSFPLITVTRRNSNLAGDAAHSAERDALELRKLLASNVVRDRRIVGSTDGSLKVVAVLNVSRHSWSTAGKQYEGEPA